VVTPRPVSRSLDGMYWWATEAARHCIPAPRRIVLDICGGAGISFGPVGQDAALPRRDSKRRVLPGLQRRGSPNLGALGYANDLISPTSGERVQGLEAVWIAQVDPRWASWRTATIPEKYSQDALEFLQRLIRDEPYWSGVWVTRARIYRKAACDNVGARRASVGLRQRN